MGLHTLTAVIPAKAEALYNSEAGQSILLLQGEKWIDQLRCCKALPLSRE
jgi:hypothetical protein